VVHTLLSAPIINYVGDFLRRKHTQRPSWIGFWLQLIEEIVSSFLFPLFIHFLLFSSSACPFLFFLTLFILPFSSSFDFLFFFFLVLPVMPYTVFTPFAFLFCLSRSSALPYLFCLFLPLLLFPSSSVFPSSSSLPALFCLFFPLLLCSLYSTRHILPFSSLFPFSFPSAFSPHLP
jgi:hypothetical protein